MTYRERLQTAWTSSGSLLCVGLDPDAARLPEPLHAAEQPFFAFGKAIADAAAPYCAAFKPQFAHFAGQGRTDELRALCRYIREAHPDRLLILDAKRGDIGSTAAFYAREAFEVHAADAVTVNPYMGGDTLDPFTCDPAHGVFVLCKTSNPGSDEFQNLRIDGGRRLFEEVARRAATDWNAHGNAGLVVGATYPAEIEGVRALAPDLPLLVPGIGTQGGNLEATLRAGLDARGSGMLINASRSIIHAGSGSDFAHRAADAARALNDQINALRP
ncbi:MAG: orotidine-5'-phosphate decarboxylase [Opitutales bacterium]|nr:orotidine-5'-phosphate decarboxylase [Opitutales bacterium]